MYKLDLKNLSVIFTSQKERERERERERDTERGMKNYNSTKSFVL
jgi:hypothetical protein